MAHAALDPPGTTWNGHAGTPMYHDGLIPLDRHDPPVVLDHDPRVATLDGQKAVIVGESSEKEAGLPPSYAALPPPLTPTICGLRRRAFYTILAVAVLLIAVIAGLAGGLTARRDSSNVDSPETVSESSGNSESPETRPSNSSPSPSTTTSASTSSSTASVSTILDKSQLAAARSSNSTITASYVAYQDPFGSLMLAAWDTEWRTVNISDRMLKAAFPVRPKLGTPLAVVTGEHTEVHVIFLDQGNAIREVYSKDGGRYQTWSRSSLYDESEIAAQAQSRLAAHWNNCHPKCASSEDETGQVRMFFENQPGSFVTYRGAKWEQLRNFSATGREGSALATTPYYRSDSDRTHMMFFYDTGEKLGMMTRTVDQADWAYNDAFAGATHPTFAGQQIAATAFEVDPRGEKDVKDSAILAVQLGQDGKLALTYWDPRIESKGSTDKWTFGSPVQLEGGPQPTPSFTAIAMNLDGKFYGIADGAVLEYTVQRDDVTRFVYKPGNVTSTP